VIIGVALWAGLAEARSVSGEVRVAGSGLGAPGVPVAIGERIVETDADGRFSASDLSEEATAVAIPGTDLRVRVPAGAEDLSGLVIWVHPADLGNESVVRYAVPGDPMRERIEAEDVRIVPGTLGDPLRAAQQAPGVQRAPFDAGWVLIRGGDPDDTPVLYDGVPMPALYHLGGFTSAIHPGLVSRVDVWPGAPPTRVTGGLSGAVELAPSAASGASRVEAGVNLAFAQAFTEIRTGPDRAVMLAGRRSWLDGALGLVLTPEQAQVAPRFWDASARYVAPRVDVLATVMGDTINIPDPDDGSSVPVGQLGGSVHATLRPAVAVGELVVRPYVSFRRPELGGDFALTSFQTQSGLQLLRDVPVGESTAQAGVDLRVRTASFTHQSQLREAWAFQGAPFGELRFATDRVEGRAGLRIETFASPGRPFRAAPVPRLSLKFPIVEGLSATVDADGGVQPARDSLLYGQPDGAYLPLERSARGAAGVRWQDRRFNLGLSGYGGGSWGRAEIERDGTVGVQQGLAYGVEFDGKAELDPVDLQLLARWGRSLRRERPASDIEYPDIPDPREYQPMVWEQPVGIQAIAAFKLPKGFSISARFRLHSGAPLDLPEDTFDILSQTQVALEPGDDLRLDTYHSLDTKFAWRGLVKRWRVDVYIDVWNVYNRRVPEPVYHGLLDGYTPYGFGLPILPLLGVDVAAAFPPRSP
jgi:hypothetical protein